VDIRDTVYFDMIAETGHLGRAAEQLGRTQPELTKCIRRLEDEIGAEYLSGADGDCSSRTLARCCFRVRPAAACLNEALR
jgi:DNA-binding transcriptional LysR family regulator